MAYHSKIKRICFAGDTAFKEPFAIGQSLKNVLKSHDIAVFNLEGAFSKLCQPLLKAGSHILLDAKYIASLAECFNVATLANNHAMDFQVEGLETTIEECRKVGIRTVGAGLNLKEAFTAIDIGNCRIVSVAEHEFGGAEENKAGIATVDKPHEIYKAIREGCDLGKQVFIVSHGGSELVSIPPPYLRERYKLWIDYGVAAVIGNHPHVVQGYELYKDRPIFYSLGNFIFIKDNSFDNLPNAHWSIAVSIDIADNNIRVIPIHSGKNNVVDIATDNQYVEEFTRLCNLIQSDNYFDLYKQLASKLYKSWYPRLSTTSLEDAALLLHYLRCDAHRNLVQTALSQRIGETQSCEQVNQVKIPCELVVAPYKLEVGGQRHIPGWITTDKSQLDVTNLNDWKKQFKPGEIKIIFAEHMLEHLHPDEAKQFLKIAYEYLCDGGRIRLAVPDAMHPSAWYHELCKPGGVDVGSDDHKYFFSYDNINEFFDHDKYNSRLLEWWDEHGFHKAQWQNDDANGKIERSSQFYDGRIAQSKQLQELLYNTTPEKMRPYYSQYGITYTSLIFDLIKKKPECAKIADHPENSEQLINSRTSSTPTITTIDGRILDLPQLPPENLASHKVPTELAEIVQSVHRWSNPKLAYLASADQWLGFEAFFKKNYMMQCDIFYCVIGGLGGLNLLPLLKPLEKLVFYDANIYAAAILDLQLQLIRHCTSVDEYICLIYQRPFDSSKYNFHNQADFFRLPIEQKYGEKLVEILSPQAYETYKYFYLPYILKLPLPLYDGPSIHCTHLLPFFESDDLKAPLVSGPLRNTSVNVNTFYVGRGWLSSDETFQTVRSHLLNSEIEVLIGDIAQVRPTGKFPGIYMTNIYSTQPGFDGYKQFVHLFRWMIGYDDYTDWEVQYYSNNTTEGMVEYEKLVGAGNGNAHATCCQAIDSLLDLHNSQFLEVIEPHPTEGMNYGFRFYEGQKRISVGDYLKTDILNEEIIVLHILLGSGTSQQLWREICRKAVRESGRFVMIFEHRKECTDWPQWDVHSDNLLSHRELDQFVYSLDYRWGKYGMPNVKGDISDVRNIMYFLDKSRPVTGFDYHNVISNSDLIPAVQQVNEYVCGAGQSSDLANTKGNSVLAKDLFKQGMNELCCGNSRRSLSFFNQAIAACPEMLELHYAMATAYVQLGDMLSARKACNDELVLNPQNSSARRLLERIEGKANEPQTERLSTNTISCIGNKEQFMKG